MKYGLRPGTLKFELFKVLSEQGNSGLKVSDLAKSLQVSYKNMEFTCLEGKDVDHIIVINHLFSGKFLGLALTIIFSFFLFFLRLLS